MKKTYPLARILVAAVFLVGIGASAQTTEAVNTQAARLMGTVVDVGNDPVPDATVVLQAPGGDTHKVVTKDDGAFSFEDVAPGIAYQVTVTAEGLSEWKSAVTIEPGQNKTLTGIRLRPATVQRAVTVGYSAKEVAAQQLKAEEQQRVLGVIPNMFVTYEPHAEPLTPRMKFHLAYKALTHPSFFVLMAAWSGVEQAADTPDWQQNAKGYGQRFGANLAGGTVEILFTNAILASALHQDPRYFYQGTGTKKARARHALGLQGRQWSMAAELFSVGRLVGFRCPCQCLLPRIQSRCWACIQKFRDQHGPAYGSRSGPGVYLRKIHQ
jgi:hypothetical protein